MLAAIPGGFAWHNPTGSSSGPTQALTNWQRSPDRTDTSPVRPGVHTIADAKGSPFSLGTSSGIVKRGRGGPWQREGFWGLALPENTLLWSSVLETDVISDEVYRKWWYNGPFLVIFCVQFRPNISSLMTSFLGWKPFSRTNQTRPYCPRW